MGNNLTGLLYTDKITGESGIEKIEFWRFYKPFIIIFEIGREEFYDTAGFKNGYPAFYSVMIYSAIISDT